MSDDARSRDAHEALAASKALLAQTLDANAELRSACNRLTDELLAAHDQVHRLDAQHRVDVEQLADADGQHAVDKRQLEYYQQKVADLQSELVGVRGVNRDLNTQITEHRHEIEELTEFVAKFKSHVKERDLEIASLHEQLHTAHREFDEREAAARELRELLIRHEWWAQAGDALNRTIS